MKSENNFTSLSRPQHFSNHMNWCKKDLPYNEGDRKARLLTCRSLVTRLGVITFVELSPSWEANSSLACQQIPRILWNPKVRYRFNKLSPPISILSQINQVHVSLSHSLKMEF
jgi:hypothetical protein